MSLIELNKSSLASKSLNYEEDHMENNNQDMKSTFEVNGPSKKHEDSSLAIKSSSGKDEGFRTIIENPSVNHEDPLANSSQELFSSNHIFNYDISNEENSPNQQYAFREYQLMTEPLEFEDDYEFGLNYNNVPEYDVREKLQSLNAQLASEPHSEHRNSKVAFKDELVSLVAPADYYESESDLDENHYPTNPTSIGGKNEIITTSADFNSEDQNLILEENHLKKENETDVSQIVENNKSDSLNGEKKKENMVISRGGKFQFLSSQEIMDGSKRISENQNDKLLKKDNSKQVKNRPISAPPSKRYVHVEPGSSVKSSVNLRSNSQLQKQNEKLKIEIPRIDKDVLRRQQERKKKREEELMKRDEEEQNMRKEMNSKCFEAWLEIKQKQRKEEDEKRKKEEDEEKERKERQHEERKYNVQEIESELNKKLEYEKRKEEKLKQYRLKEIEDSIIIHSDEECQKAFKDWLKKKHKDHKNKVKEEKRNARLTRLAMRQCRKSQDLAQAIQQSSGSRYLDFC